MMKIMIIILEVVLCCLPIGLLGILFWSLFDLDEKIPRIRYASEMSHSKYKQYARLSFERFKTFYRANPAAWSLYEFEVGRWDSNLHCWIYFCFNYSDWRKYCKFQKQLEKEKAERYEHWLDKERDKDLLRLTELVQQDIDRLNEKAEKERKSAEKVAVRVAENLTNKKDGVLTQVSRVTSPYRTYNEILEIINDNISKWEQL